MPTRIDIDGPGELVRHALPGHAGLTPRFLDVWLPPGGAAGSPVVYCHDGQNLVDPGVAFAGVPWRLHRAAVAAAEVTGVPAPVLAGLWNAGEARYREYLPPEPDLQPVGAGHNGVGMALAGSGRVGDAYLRLVTDVVVPLVEGEHGVSTEREHRSVLGSSMGGLAALYAALARPDVFAAAGCVSTHWVIGGPPLVDWFAQRLPGPGTSRLWFDRGTLGLDAEYGPLQDRMDAALRARGLRDGVDWVSRVYEGADHDEASWAERAHEVLAYLMTGRAPART